MTAAALVVAAALAVSAHPARSERALERALPPGTVAPFLFGPGSPGFGLAPDGVAGVIQRFRAGSPLRTRVRHNFWIVNNPSLLATPCGLDWTAPGGVVLRTVASCTKDTT